MKISMVFASALAACFLVPNAGVLAKPAPKPLVVDIKNAAGQSVGTATLTDAAPGVRVKLDIPLPLGSIQSTFTKSRSANRLISSRQARIFREWPGRTTTAEQWQVTYQILRWLWPRMAPHMFQW
jgi:hypothetical protein